MARKRLSDLLREEGQKAGEGPAAKPADPSPQTADTPLDEEPAIPITAEVIAAQAEQVGEFVADLRSAAVEPEPEPEPEPELEPEPEPAASHRHPTKADLEATIAELKANLKTAEQMTRTQTAALQDQIAQLQTQITTQETTIQQLQAEVQQAEKQADQVKTELATAKQMILQLSQVNAPPAQAPAKPPAQMPAQMPAQTPTKAPTPAASLPKPLASSRAAEPELETTKTEWFVPPAKPAASAADHRPKLHELALRKVLDHPTQPGSLPPMSAEAKPAEKEGMRLTDTDVGWMD